MTQTPSWFSCKKQVISRNLKSEKNCKYVFFFNSKFAFQARLVQKKVGAQLCATYSRTWDICDFIKNGSSSLQVDMILLSGTILYDFFKISANFSSGKICTQWRPALNLSEQLTQCCLVFSRA